MSKTGSSAMYAVRRAEELGLGRVDAVELIDDPESRFYGCYVLWLALDESDPVTIPLYWFVGGGWISRLLIEWHLRSWVRSRKRDSELDLWNWNRYE